MGLCGSKQAVGASGDADAPAKPAPSTGSESKAPTAAPSSPIRALRVESGDLDSSAGGGAGADDAGPGIDVVLSHHQYTNSPVIGKRAADGPADEGGGVDSPGVALDHHESRVMMALSTKRLAMQRHRRHDIKAESFKDVLSTMHEEETDMTFERKVIEKDEASRQFIRDALGANFLFAGLNDETTEFVVDAVDKRHFSAGDTVVKQGDDGDHFYVLQKGQCDVAVNGSPQGKIDQGGHFGDLSLLYNTPIASTITAAQDCVFWTLDRRSFRTLIVQTNARDIHANYKFLRNVPMLRKLGAEKLHKLAEALSPVVFKPGAYIIRQGEPGTIFYIIKKGGVLVTKTMDGEAEEEELLTLTVGDHFGERALLKSEPRAANVKAADRPVTCMALDREFFDELLGPLGEHMTKAHSQREILASKNIMERQSSRERTESTASGAGGAAGSPSGSAAAEASVELRTDIRLSDLRPLFVLGEGAFGVVQLVQHTATREVFALKKMQKARIVKTGQQRNVVNEKRVLSTCRHPYILKLVASFKDKNCLYMLLEFLQGGDIFGHLYKQGGRFNVPQSQYYSATVLLVLEYLHNKDIAYRDLKPENLVLDSRGYLKVVDFGFAKTVKDRTYTLCGTPEYLAPELVQGKGHNRAVDYWALGILLYEMLSGYSPFADEERNDQLTIYKNIIKGRVVFSKRFKSESAKDLVLRLLEGNPMHRIGLLKNGAQDIKEHDFFHGFDIAALAAKKVLPPIIPEISDATDTRNFDEVDVEASSIVPFHGDDAWCNDF